MKGRYPKYIDNAKQFLDIKRSETEKTIFDDIFESIKEGATYDYIGEYIIKKYDLKFDSKRQLRHFIIKLINDYCPNCIICGKPRYHCPRKIILYCETCYERCQDQIDESTLLTRLQASENFQVDDLISYHGDVTSQTTDDLRLGTTDITPHRFKNFEQEQRRIKAEFEILGLKRDKVRKRT